MAKKPKKAKNYQDVVMSYYITNTIRNRSLFQFLKPLSEVSVHIYNQCLYFAKLMYNNNQAMPSIETIDHNCRYAEAPFDYYKQIQALASDDFAGKTIRLHYTPIQSFVGLKETDKELNGTPQLPRYKNTQEDPTRSFATRVRLNDKKGETIRSMIKEKQLGNKSYYYLQILKTKNIWIPIPKCCQTEELLISKGMKEFQINFIPISCMKYKIQILYRKPIQESCLDRSRMLFIDLGTRNFATCITNDPSLYPVILNGNELLNLNRYLVNSQNTHSRICQIQQKIDTLIDAGTISENIVPSKTRIVKDIREYRKRVIREIFLKYKNFLLTYCQRHNIGTIVIGENKGWKQNTKQTKGQDGNRKFGKTATREFQNIPYDQFKFQLEYSAKILGIQYIASPEAYTSQVDHLAQESLEFHPSSKVEGMKRNYIMRNNGQEIILKNGKKKTNNKLFISKSGIVINADVNGAMGIGRKYCLENNIPEPDFNQHVQTRSLFTPIRIKYHQLNQPKTQFNWNQFHISTQNSTSLTPIASPIK